MLFEILGSSWSGNPRLYFQSCNRFVSLLAANMEKDYFGSFQLNSTPVYYFASHCFKLPNFINIPDFFPTPLRFSFSVSIWEAPLARLRIFNLTVILNDSTTEVPAPDRLKIGQDIVVIVASEMGTLPLAISIFIKASTAHLNCFQMVTTNDWGEILSFMEVI